MLRFVCCSTSASSTSLGSAPDRCCSASSWCFAFTCAACGRPCGSAYVTGAMMLIPVLSLVAHPARQRRHSASTRWASSFISRSPSRVLRRGGRGTFSNHLALRRSVWFWVIGWVVLRPGGALPRSRRSSTTRRTTPARRFASAGILNCFLCLLLPLTIVCDPRHRRSSPRTPTFIVVSQRPPSTSNRGDDARWGSSWVFLSAGLLLSMNTATMDGSRALYGMAKEGLTVKQLDRLNGHHVPGRAMALDWVLNACLLLFSPRPPVHPRGGEHRVRALARVRALRGSCSCGATGPIGRARSGSRRTGVRSAWICLTVNIVGTIFGNHALDQVHGLPESRCRHHRRGAALRDCGDHRGPGLGLAAGVLGYVIGQIQHGRKFRWTDPSDEPPSPEAYELMAAPGASAAPAAAGD